MIVCLSDRRRGIVCPSAQKQMILRFVVFFGAGSGMGAPVQNMAIPVMLFCNLVGIDFPEEIPWGFLLAFYRGAFAA